MASTLLLDTATWDLVLDADGDIAVAGEPYSLAQDAASAIKTFQGECWWDTSVGVPYLTQILSKTPSLGYVKEQFNAAALTVPGVAAASSFVTGITNRSIAGQVQVQSQATGAVAVMPFATPPPFAVVDPQI